MMRKPAPLNKRRLYVLLYTFALVALYPLAHEHLGLLAVFVFLAASPLYYGGSTVVAALRNKRLDEREQQLAYKGFKVAYEIFVVTILVSLAVNRYSGPAPEVLGTLNDFFLFNSEVLLNFWTLLLLAVVLPVCVLAWLEPDPVSEDATPALLHKEPA